MAGENGETETWSELCCGVIVATAPGARKPLASQMPPPECEVCDFRELAEVLLFLKMAEDVDAPNLVALGTALARE
jgi:hypothetical protein